MMKTRLALIMIALLALGLAACTRSATTATVPPTDTPAGVGGGDGGATQAVDNDPTMAALGTQLAATQTAQAGGSTGQSGTPESPQSLGTATPTPLAPQPEISATATAIVTPVPTKAAVAQGCSSPYTVKSGDWLYKIARDCQLTPAAVAAANPSINPNRLTPGQQIILPGASSSGPAPTTAPAASCTGSYTVKGGDNLFRLAFNCGLTTEQLARTNNIPAPYRIFPGQVINYP